MEALARRAGAPIFALTLFSSAALIFVLQPLFGRMVTPLLGGSPQVWNTSMAFFQAALLAGYLYAHLLARVRNLRVQTVAHALALLAAWFVLPVQVSTALGPPNSNQPELWLLGVLSLSVGAPFAVASATAPLLQAWYARTGRTDAHDPYYLYAASNLGSFVGLLGYPILVEPWLGAQAQSAAWSIGYLIVAGGVALSAALAISAHGPTPKPLEHSGSAPGWRQRAYWIAAAAVPSALSLGVTLHISTDVASAPMLWVVPLALYLLTFVLAFMRRSGNLGKAALAAQPVFVAIALIASFGVEWQWSVGLILSAFFFSALICHFALARSRPSADRLTEFYLYVSLGGVLGGAFAALAAPLIFNNVYEYPLALAAASLFRPREDSDTPRLRDATLAAAIMMAVLAVLLQSRPPHIATLIVGALGAAAALISAAWTDEERPSLGRYVFLAFAALDALLIIYVAFNHETVFTPIDPEKPNHVAASQPWRALLMFTSFMLIAFTMHAVIQRRRDNRSVADYAAGAGLVSAIFVLVLLAKGASTTANELTIMSVVFCGVGVFLNRGRAWAMAAIVLLAFFIIFVDEARGARIITQERSFFGVLRTREFRVGDPHAPPFRLLLHGTTIHGAQLVGEGFSRQPLTYYHPRTALGEAIVAGLSTGDTSSLALIGLGTGSTACLMRPDDRLTILEIDPAVVRLSARQGGDFTFVSECQPGARIELGDARLQIAEEPDGAFDVIVVDAFSSDAIPAHLLTREAIALYLSKLSDRGIVILHLSNRNLALVSEAARVARDLNAPAIYRISDRFEQPYVSYYGGMAASVMIIAKSPQTIGALAVNPDWRVLTPPAGRGWSDDYINLPRALWQSLMRAEECFIRPHLRRCQPEPTSNGRVSPGAPPSP
jgi:uncharacterized membrane protein YoaK (UPF0700 family)